MTELHWAIKSSFVAYVRGMPDGVVTLERGAQERDGTFVFPQNPGDSEYSFSGSVVFEGHGGMLRVRFCDPAIIEEHGRTVITLADPDSPGDRIVFATVDLSREEGSIDGISLSGASVALTTEGAELFFGPYEKGTPFDDLIVIAN